MNADVVFVFAAVEATALGSQVFAGGETARTDTICATDGRTPAIA